MKFMRAKSERPFILTFLGQYHGESYGAQAVGAQGSGYSRFMRELNNGYVHVPYPHPYRCPFHRNAEECDGVCVIDYLREQILPYLVALDRLPQLAEQHEIVGEARVKGLYIAVEFVSDRTKKTKGVELARAVHFACLERGIVDIYDRGMHVVRWQPALTTPPDMLSRACDFLEDAIAEVEASR